MKQFKIKQQKKSQMKLIASKIPIKEKLSKLSALRLSTGTFFIVKWWKAYQFLEDWLTLGKQ